MTQNQNGKNQLSKTQKVIALSVASLFSTLFSVVLAMAMARLLSKTEVAAYRQTLLAYQTVAPFLGLGIASGIYYILPRNEGRKRAVVYESLFILFVTGVLFAVFLLAGGNRILAAGYDNPQVETLLYWLVPMAIFGIPATIFGSVYVAFDHVKLNAKYQAFGNLFVIATVLLFVFLIPSAKSAIISNTIGQVLLSVVGVVLLFAIIPHDGRTLKGSSMIQIIRFSLPLGLSSMVGTLDSMLDKWIVSLMLPPEEYAVFSNGAQEIPLVSSITGAVATVIMVEMVLAAKNKDYDSAITLFRSVGEKTSLLLFPIMLFFMAVATPFIKFMYTDAYLAAVPVFRVYLLYLPIRTVFYGSLLIALGKSGQVLIRSLISLVCNAVISVIFVRLIGAVGASIATIVVIYAFNVPMNLYLICKETKYQWTRVLPFRQYGKCLLLALPATAACMLTDFLVSQLHVILRLCIDGIVFAAVLAVFYIPGFHLNIKQIVKRIVATKRK